VSGHTSRADKRLIRTGDEQDVLTGWRAVYCWTKRAGATSRVKRRARRRERHEARAILAKGGFDA